MARVRARRIRSGLETVEAALVLPLVCLVLFGMMEYGSMFLKTEQITNTARQAARYAATPDATSAQVQSKITSMMNDAGLGSSGYQVTLTPADVAALSPGQLLTVKIIVPYGNISIGGGAQLLPTPANVGATVAMAKEGPAD